jgi:hypothetical protein
MAVFYVNFSNYKQFYIEIDFNFEIYLNFSKKQSYFKF